MVYTAVGKKKIKLTGIPKLDDANKAGGRESKKCTLILTEGDSAKTFATSGLNIIGRDYYGIFPLKGKLLNARVNLIENNLAEVSLNNSEDGISPGQACVFYDLDKIGHKVLGGGWIVS